MGKVKYIDLKFNWQFKHELVDTWLSIYHIMHFKKYFKKRNLRTNKKTYTCTLSPYLQKFLQLRGKIKLIEAHKFEKKKMAYNAKCFTLTAINMTLPDIMVKHAGQLFLILQIHVQLNTDTSYFGSKGIRHFLKLEKQRRRCHNPTSCSHQRTP